MMNVFNCNELYEIKNVNIHIYQSTFQNESRILKITKSLSESKKFIKMIIIAKLDTGLPQFENIDEYRLVVRIQSGRIRFFGRIGLFINFLIWSIRVLRFLYSVETSYINCHSLPVLPLSVLIKFFKRAKLVYDTHELETETLNCRGLRKVASKILERIFIRFVDETVVVNQAIADWYQDTYRLKKVHVVRNVPYQGQHVGSEGLLRRELGIPAEDLLFLYVGVVSHGRGIKMLIEAFRQVPGNRHLVIMGYGELVPQVQEMAEKYQNIHFHPAVAPDRIAGYVADADVGLSLIENLCLSYFLCLPNKVFEYISSGIPVVVSDFPVMAATIDEMKCGWKIPVDCNSLISLVSSLSAEQISAKAANAKSASRDIGWHMEEPKLFAIYKDLF